MEQRGILTLTHAVPGRPAEQLKAKGSQPTTTGTHNTECNPPVGISVLPKNRLHKQGSSDGTPDGHAGKRRHYMSSPPSSPSMKKSPLSQHAPAVLRIGLYECFYQVVDSPLPTLPSAETIPSMARGPSCDCRCLQHLAFPVAWTCRRPFG